jgi:hypothetical protein
MISNNISAPIGHYPLGGWFKKGEFAEAIGRSRGGRMSKIHALADDRLWRVPLWRTQGRSAAE